MFGEITPTKKSFRLRRVNLKAHQLFDIIYQISKRHIAKQMFIARTKLGGRKKKKIQRTIEGLSILFDMKSCETKFKMSFQLSNDSS